MCEWCVLIVHVNFKLELFVQVVRGAVIEHYTLYMITAFPSDIFESKTLIARMNHIARVNRSTERVLIVRHGLLTVDLQVPRGYIRCDFFIVTHGIIVHEIIC